MSEQIDHKRIPPPRFSKPQVRLAPVVGSIKQGAPEKYRPGIVVNPTDLSGHIPLGERLAQFWLFGVALVGLWGGISFIAFEQGDSNVRFLWLGIGGLLSFAKFFWIVERQRRKHGALSPMHDYILGLGFFFLATGVFWGLRWLIAFISDPEAMFGYTIFLEDGVAFADKWHPNAYAIYVQLTAAVLICLFQWAYLKKANGGTFGWFIATITPFALLAVGIGPWLRWSNGDVSYEIGISIVVLSSLGMILAIQSDRGIVFAIAANVASLIPILYEIFQDSEGSAISLLFFIIFVQGGLAASSKLKQELVQITSIGLVLTVIFAMIYAQINDLTLHLASLKLPIDSWFSFPTAFWFATLIGFMWAVHLRRVPWMPIGMALALTVIPHPGNQIAWGFTLILLPYMLWNPTTRRWVADFTFMSVALAFLIVDWMTFGQSMGEDFWGAFSTNDFIYIPPLVLLVTGELARRFGKLSNTAFRVAILLLVLSHSMLGAESNALPWAFAFYLMFSAIEAYKENTETTLESRKNLTLTVFTSMILTLLLAAFGRLEIEADFMSAFNGFNVVLLMIAITYYGIGFKHLDRELDLGHLFRWGSQSGGGQVFFDPKSNSWFKTVEAEQNEDGIPSWLSKGWGSVARTTLLIPMILCGIAVASVDAEVLLRQPWILVLILPVTALIRDVMKPEGNSSTSRAIGVFALFLMFLPVRLVLASAGVGDNIGLGLTAGLFDLMLIGGPLTVNYLLIRRGLDDETLNENADKATLIGLLLLGTLDASGGIASIALFILVVARAVKHRQALLIYIAPLMWMLFEGRLSMNDGFIDYLFNDMLGMSGLAEYLVEESNGLSRIIGFLWLAYALAVHAQIALDRKTPVEGRTELPYLYPSLFALLGLTLVLPDVEWLLLAITSYMTIYGWLTGRLNVFLVASPAFLLSIMIGLEDSAMSEAALFSMASFWTGLISLGMYLVARYGFLDMFAPEPKQSDPTDPVQGIFEGIDTIIGRQNLTNLLYGYAIIFLMLGYDEFWGLSTVIIAIWVTIDSYRRGLKHMFLATPLAHGFAIWNLTRHIDSMPAELGGWIVMIDGIILAVIAWKNWYPNWSWNEDGSDYWEWNDQAGMLSVIYFTIGGWWSLFDVSEIGFAAVLILYCGAQTAMDMNSNWRRIAGIFGTTFGAGIVFFTTEDTLLAGVVLILGGLAAFIQGILYMQRWGQGVASIKPGGEAHFDSSNIIKQTEKDSDEGIESDELQDEATEEIAEEDTEDETVVPTGTLTPSVAKEAKKVVVIKQEQVERSIDTGMGWKLNLPMELLDNIHRAMSATEHEGFEPVATIDKAGKVTLDWTPMSGE